MSVIASQYSASVVIGSLIANDYPYTTVYYQQSFTVPSGINKVSSITVYGEKTSPNSYANVSVTLNGVTATRSTSGWSTGSGVWRVFTFSSPVSVTAGTETFTVTCDAGSRFGLWACSTCGGTGYYKIGTGGWGYDSYTTSPGGQTVFYDRWAFYVDGYTEVVAGAPKSVQPTAVSSITHNSAHFSSAVWDDNGASITRAGFVISNVTSAPTVPTHEIWRATGEGSFSYTHESLQSGYTYVVRSYATNSEGTTYGAVTSFYVPFQEASITNSVSFTAGNNIPLTISNPGNFYLRATLYVNGTYINGQNLGQVTSGTLTSLTSGSLLDAIYAQMPNSKSTSMYVRLQSYTTSSYGTQVGSNKDKTGTVTINDAVCKPIFSDWEIESVDKAIAVADKYGNTLVSTTTNTLTGATNKIIIGKTKLRATVSVANKMEAINGASENYYRIFWGNDSPSASYSATEPVTLDFDNVASDGGALYGYDSRYLYSGSSKVLGAVTPTSVNIWGVELTRDDRVGTETKLSFSGEYWNEYFGGGTAGVQNTATVHWRYKESTATWGSQTWVEITPTDTDGALSYDEYINGDLGVSGFDADKSYDIEVRIYDELSQKIVETTLNAGLPVMDITQDGVAFGDRYDATEGGSLQVDGENVSTLEILKKVYPIGSIYINGSSDTNPATLLGFGTWTLFGAGKVLVCRDSGYAPFDSTGEIGGSLTHTLTTSEMPGHTHTQKTGARTSAWSSPNQVLAYQYQAQDIDTGYFGNSTGGSGSHSIVQPYIIVNMWRRNS